MYNDPNQPQQPYGQPQPPYGYPQQPYGQPPPSYAQPPRKRRTGLWIVLGILVVLLLLCGGGIFAFINYIQHNPATDVVNHYYTSIKNQDYASAFQDLDPTMKLTIGGNEQQATQTLFIQAAQALDNVKGKVTDYKVTSTSLNTNNGVSTGTFTVNVTRNGAPYDVHLQLRQEGNDWKIVKFDNL
ncbi:MAG: hypothetical protein IMW89_22150 [Ktedonobacteraceae bacterium]|nr:hypothetical protein [Ktedonobacteraceae bacterium]